MTWLAYSALGVAKRLTLDTQPGGALAGIPFVSQPVGRLLDGSGVLSRTTGTVVTVSKLSGTGTLSGTLTAVTVEGVFTFTDLKMDTVTGTVVLRFTAPGLVSVDSNSFNVTQPNTTIGIESGTYVTTGTDATLSRGPYMMRQDAAGSYVVTGTSTTLTYSGASELTPSGTIIFDTRAGGAEDWQTKTTLAELHSVWSFGTTTGGSFATDCDGNGTNGKRIDWTAGNPATEQTCQLMKYLPANNSAANGMYWQWKVKYASNFVYNSNGQGAKIWLGLRANDNSTDRLYWVESNAGWKVACDSRGWTTSTYGTGPAVDTVMTYTIFCKGPGGIVKCWRDDTLVIDLTGQNINTSGFTEMQFNVAEYVPVVTYQYVWDFVVWVP